MIGGRIVQLLESIITGGGVKLAAGNNNIGQVGIDPNNNAIQLSGSKMELYGASLDDRPDATTVPIGATFTIVDASQEFRSWISDGTNWLEV